MKKLIGCLVVLILLSGAAWCAQQNNIGSVKTDSAIGLFSRTLAQIDLIAPDAEGQLVYCSDCDFRLCVSTGTSAGAFVVVASTNPASVQGAILHCQ